MNGNARYYNNSHHLQAINEYSEFFNTGQDWFMTSYGPVNPLRTESRAAPMAAAMPEAPGPRSCYAGCNVGGGPFASNNVLAGGIKTGRVSVGHIQQVGLGLVSRAKGALSVLLTPPAGNP